MKILEKSSCVFSSFELLLRRNQYQHTMKTLAQIKEIIAANRTAGLETYAGLQSHEIGTYSHSLMFGDESEAFPSQEEWSIIVD